MPRGKSEIPRKRRILWEVSGSEMEGLTSKNSRRGSSEAEGKFQLTFAKKWDLCPRSTRGWIQPPTSVRLKTDYFQSPSKAYCLLTP